MFAWTFIDIVCNTSIGSRFRIIKKNVNVIHHVTLGEISPKFFSKNFGGERGIRTLESVNVFTTIQKPLFYTLCTLLNSGER